MIHNRFVSFVVAALLLALHSPQASSQELGWDIKAEANASLFFGNTRQSTFGTRYSAGRADSTVEVLTDGQFTYGEAETDEQREYVTKRSWRAGLTADYRPFARVSPFVLGSIESSLEKRIDRRYSAGAGAKLMFVRTERTASDFSLALLAERSLLPNPAGPRTDETIARYSARFRLDRKVGDRVTVGHETFYRPEASALDRFTFTSRTSIAFSMAASLAFQASFLDNYDSEARTRGARSNNDGEFLFGLALTM
jgi:hypothetical protein